MSTPHPIPVIEAECLAKDYGYDQVILFAFNRKKAITHTTTYGKDKALCDEAAKAANTAATVMGWYTQPTASQLISGIAHLNKQLLNLQTKS